MIYGLWGVGYGLLGGVLEEPVAVIVGGICQAGRVLLIQFVVDGLPGDTTPGFACGGIAFCIEHILGDIGEEEEGGEGAYECITTIITSVGQEETALVVGAAEDDVFEGGAGVECQVSYACHCLGYADFCQAATILECHVSYACHCFRYADFLQTFTVAECVVFYLCHCFRQSDACQTTAIIECVRCYFCYSCGYADFCQAVTIIVFVNS